MKKSISFKPKGMNRDLSVSAFNSEFSFENKNLRLSTNEGNTMLSWVNERGTEELELEIATFEWDGGSYQQGDFIHSIPGIVLGAVCIKNLLVVFAHSNYPAPPVPAPPVIRYVPDAIYTFNIEGIDDSTSHNIQGERIFYGNLNFKERIEATAVYENDLVQKIYWTDGCNQPRLINVVASFSTQGQWNQYDTHSEEHNNVTYNVPNVVTCFDFVSSIEVSNSVFSVSKENSDSGLFEPGVIQYCFTYFRKHGQQSHVVAVSPLYYITHPDRGAKPDDKVANSFRLTIVEPDINYEYVRLYSIHRTSLNAIPTVKILEDIPINSTNFRAATITFVDNGTVGYTIDPMELLYVGGKEFSALTMAHRKNTLFLGNLSTPVNGLGKDADGVPYEDIIQDYFDSYFRGGTEYSDLVSFHNDSNSIKKLTMSKRTGLYPYDNFLDKKNSSEITTFKGGETYRFGFQLQKTTGEWTNPIFIQDCENNLYPNTTVYDFDTKLVYASGTVDFSTIPDINNAEMLNFLDSYIAARPVIVYPTIGDRTVLCQGILNPTVFNALDRADNSPYAQPSWFFRPCTSDDAIKGYEIPDNTVTHPSTWDGSVPSYFQDKTINVCVLVADIADGDVSRILGQRGLKVEVIDNSIVKDPKKEDTSNTKIIIYVANEGIIDLGASSGYHKYAFLRDSYWPEEYLATFGEIHTTDGKVEAYSLRYLDGSNIVISTEVYPKYKGLVQTYNKCLGYVIDADTSAPLSYTFKFRTHERSTITNWEVEFSYIRDYSSSVDRGGNSLSYLHYANIYTDSEAQNIEQCYQAEIQGSLNTVSPVIKNVPIAPIQDQNRKSNTQFLVDQSVVTLNSPDIEFDTDVQNSSMENLSLHVIGIIPITSSVSHASIDASTMLELNHNVDGIENSLFGNGYVGKDILYQNVSTLAGKRLIASDMWNDVLVKNDNKNKSEDDKDGITTSDKAYNYIIYPWHRGKSLNNDWRTNASSKLNYKKESTLLYSLNTEYFKIDNIVAPGTSQNRAAIVDYEDISAQMSLTENNDVKNNIRLSRQVPFMQDINYYPTIDSVLYNNDGYSPKTTDADANSQIGTVNDGISMRYKSTSHAVIALLANSTNTTTIPTLPMNTADSRFVRGNQLRDIYVYWAGNNINNTIEVDQRITPVDNFFKSGGTHQNFRYLWLGELRRKSVPSRFGGNTREAIKNNVWIPAGKAVDIIQKTVTVSEETQETHFVAELNWTEGDTYYQRYDCLKTIPYTEEDVNQLTEICSFMCETHINIDGRYDRNRGQIDNTYMTPKNFNLLNPIYSQKGNFFNYKIVENETTNYPNYITYSMLKESGEKVDAWTNISLSNVLELEGNKGSISSLQLFNDQVIAFQDSATSQILFDENMQITTKEGVPIEIANSEKGRGSRFLSNNIGCKNKWSIANTPKGIYFVDSNFNSIYRYSGQFEDLSLKGGMRAWGKQNLSDQTVAYYDNKNQDVLFINDKTALAWSELAETFTSFYDYQGAEAFCGVPNSALWFKSGSIWRHQTGRYNNFFGEPKPFYMTLVNNPEPQLDKTFTNLEFRACVDGDMDTIGQKPVALLPFDSLEAWNEYQHGKTLLENKSGSSAMQHHTQDYPATSALKRKFRIWRCDIPRDNVQIPTVHALPENPTAEQIAEHEEEIAAYTTFTKNEEANGIFRKSAHPLDRMRNPWLYMKIMKDVHLYTNAQVTIHNHSITGAVAIDMQNPITETYYTKDEANAVNISVYGAWLYDAETDVNKVEVHDMSTVYFT